MRWGKIKRKLQQKPYLLDPYRVRSRRDARKMLYEQGLPCAAEVLEAARIRAGKSPKEWESLIGMSREKLARKCRAAMPVRFGHVALVSRRAVLGLGVILLLGFFFGFTYPGRALAKAVYNAVVEVMEDVLHISADTDESVWRPVPIVAGNINEEFEFDTLEELIEYVDYPVFCLDAEDAIITKISFFKSRHLGESISINYQFIDRTIKIRQTHSNYFEYGEDYLTSDECTLCSFQLSSGIMINGVLSNKDNTFVGVTAIESCVINYIISDCTTEATAISILEKLKITQ